MGYISFFYLFIYVAMGKKRIAFLDEGRSIGGAQINLLSILKGLDKREFFPLVILSCKKNLQTQLARAGIETAIVDTPRFLSTSFEVGNHRMVNPFAVIYASVLNVVKALRIARYLSKQDISVLHTNGMHEHIYGGIAAKICGLPCIWHLQDIPARDFLFGFATFFINILGTFLPLKIVAISREVKSIFFSFVQKKVVVIYNGTDTDRFKRKEPGYYSGIRNTLGFKEKDIIVCIIARIVPWKGHKVFLQAAKMVSEEIANIKFLIVGDTMFGRKSYLEQLHETADALGIKDKVVFAGFVKNVEGILGISDIVTHCSVRPEPFGLCIIEAMAAGKAVISTTLGAPAEIIEDGRDGILIEPNDPVSLARTILRLAHSEQQRSMLGRAARQKVEKEFCLERFVKQMEQVYLSLPRRMRQ